MKGDVVEFDDDMCNAHIPSCQAVDADFQQRPIIDFAGLLGKKMDEELAAVILKKNEADPFQDKKRGERRKRMRKRGKSGTDIGGEDLQVSQLKEK